MSKLHPPVEGEVRGIVYNQVHDVRATSDFRNTQMEHVKLEPHEVGVIVCNLEKRFGITITRDELFEHKTFETPADFIPFVTKKVLEHRGLLE